MERDARASTTYPGPYAADLGDDADPFLIVLRAESEGLDHLDVALIDESATCKHHFREAQIGSHAYKAAPLIQPYQRGRRPIVRNVFRHF